MSQETINALILIGVASILIGLYWLRSQQRKRQLRQKIAGGAKVIDVRSPEEFASGHFGGAINIPHDRIEKSLKALGSPETPVILYCASGMRSGLAAQALRSAGFRDVTNAGRRSALPE